MPSASNCLMEQEGASWVEIADISAKHQITVTFTASLSGELLLPIYKGKTKCYIGMYACAYIAAFLHVYNTKWRCRLGM